MADYKIEFHPAIIFDIKELKLNPIQFSDLKEKLISASKDIEAATKNIRGLPSQFRKLKFYDKRIFLCISKDTLFILKIAHRRQAYSQESLGKILQLVKDFSG